MFGICIYGIQYSHLINTKPRDLSADAYILLYVAHTRTHHTRHARRSKILNSSRTPPRGQTLLLFIGIGMPLL